MKTPKCPIVFSEADDHAIFDGRLRTKGEVRASINALLEARWAEAVANAPEVFKNEIWGTWNGDGHRPFPEDSHSARLFCIENLEGEK